MNAPPFDLVVRDGTVADGLAGDLRAADVAVKDGRIAAVGVGLARGQTEVDAKGLIVTISQAVSMLTRQSAEAVGLSDRGRIAVGYKADLNIIDPDRLGLGCPHIVLDLPAGGGRFMQSAGGYVATIVSGEVIRRNGEHVGALPGRLVRGRQRTLTHGWEWPVR